MSKTMRRALLLAVLVLVVAGAAGASATEGRAGSNKLTGCRNTSTGTLDQVKAGLLPMGGACGTGEVAVTWNKRGPRGPQGATGATGAPGVSGYVRVENSYTSSALGMAGSVNCPAGKKVVGGGYYVTPLDVTVRKNGPVGDNGWIVDVRRVAASGEYTLTVWGICVTALP